MVTKRTVRLLTHDLNKLELLNESKDQLFSIVSHDLRSSLYAININMAKIKTWLSPLTGDLIALVENIQRIIATTQSLLDNLLYWSLGQTGQVIYNPERISLRPLINHICYDFDPMAAAKDIYLSQSIPDDVSCTADLSLLKLILRNIIDNAIKYTPAGGSILISARQEERRCMITVTDTGNGMEPETLRAIFDNDSTRIGQDAYGRRSTGLGLSLVKNMMEKNGGVLQISSEKGKWTVVKLMLPQ